MDTRVGWIMGGGVLGLVLGLIAGNTLIGIAITTVLGAAAGAVAHYLRDRRPNNRPPGP